MPELEECSGFQYLRDTSYNRETVHTVQRPAIAQVKTFKTYPDAQKVALPRNWELSEARITPLLQKRRSLRRFLLEPVTMEELAFLLWCSQGITGKAGNYSFRAAPSGGALYPVETYLSAHLVEDLDPGLYHFNVEEFALDRISDKDSADDIAEACMNQRFMAQSAVTFLWTAVYRRCMSKYGNRGMRYILMDSGHICQNLLLAAEAIGCGGCPVAAFYDDEVNALLQLDAAEETIIYSAAVGKREKKALRCTL